MPNPRPLFLILLTVIFSCAGNEQEQEPKGEVFPSDTITDLNLEYAVINQTLPQAPSWCPLGDYNMKVVMPDSFAIARFNEKYTAEEQELIKQHFESENLSLNEVTLIGIRIVVVDPVLLKYKGLADVPIELDKLNHPHHIILIDETHPLYKEEHDYTYFGCSRVKFNEEGTKAYYYYYDIYGPLNGAGYEVECELKNGAWTITEHKMVWIS